MTVHGRRVRRCLLAARAAQFEPRVRPRRLAPPVLDPVLGVRPQVLVLGPIKGVVGRTPVVAALEIDSKPFFGPVKRADGVFQLYVELPYHHYLEIDSLTFNGTVGTPAAQAWADVV